MRNSGVPFLPLLNGLLQVTSMFYTRTEQMQRTGYWCASGVRSAFSETFS